MVAWLCVGMLGLLPGPGHAATGSREQPLAELLRGPAERGSFSGVVCVFDDTSVVSEVAVGLADASRGTPQTTDALFRIGSLSKVVVALALLRMEEQGEIDLGASSAPAIARALGQAPPLAERQPTYWELLNHTSGLRDPPSLWLPFLVGEDRRVSTARELLPLGLGAARRRAPGERFAYANVNYALLAEALRLRTGGSYEARLRSLLSEPLGLEDLGVVPEEAQRARLSQGHFNVLGRLVPREQLLGSAPDAYRDEAASGNLFASCRDFAALLRAAVWGPLFQREETRRQWLEPARAHYAGGVLVDVESGRRRLRHAGAVVGYSSLFELYPEARRGFVLLSNLDASAVESASLARALRAFVLGDGAVPGTGGAAYEAAPSVGRRLLVALRLGLHAALAPTMVGRIIQVLLVLAVTAGLIRKRSRDRLDALARASSASGLCLMLSSLGEMGLTLSLLLLLVPGGGALRLLIREHPRPWLSPRGSERVSSVLSCVLGMALFVLGATWSQPAPRLFASALLLLGLAFVSRVGRHVRWAHSPGGGQGLS